MYIGYCGIRYWDAIDGIELIAIVYPANKASERILQKICFEYTGDVEIPDHGPAKKYLLKP